MLEATEKRSVELEHFGLGPALNQCCGGAVRLLFERFDREPRWLSEMQAVRHDKAFLITALDTDRPSRYLVQMDDDPAGLDARLASAAVAATQKQRAAVMTEDGREYLVEDVSQARTPFAVFGAGHVGRALVPILAEQPFELYWFDTRSEAFPGNAHHMARFKVTPDPVGEVAELPSRTSALVMTHSHKLDEDLCDALLGRTDLPWLGLIGSETKRRRFRHRLAARGHGEASLAKLRCPVGIAGIGGKRPATIAVAMAAEILRDCIPEHWR